MHSYYNQQGIIVNSSYESLKARITLDQQISKKVKAGVTFNFSNNTSKGSAPSQGGGGSTQYFLYQVLAYRPIFYSDSEDAEDKLLRTIRIIHIIRSRLLRIPTQKHVAVS